MRILDAVRTRATIRNVRLVTGLILFTYVLSHLVNHALGNASLAAMNAFLDWNAGFWNTRPMPWLLYGGLLAHAGLGIWAVYARPRLPWRPAEAAQLLLGLSLPPLLVAHVVGTKIANTLFGTVQGYDQLLYIFWVASPADGIKQAVALLVAWVHGCLGLYFWLRLKPGFPRGAPILLAVAILVPVLALLGSVQGGREVMALSVDEAWRIENVPASPADSEVVAAQVELLGNWRTGILTGFGVLLLGAFAARGIRRAAERRRGLVRITYPDGRVAHVTRGTSVLEASRLIRVPHASVCGGRGRCSTCRVRVFGDGAARLPPPEPPEHVVLERVRAGPSVRLACQLRPDVDLKVAPLVPPEAAFAEARRRQAGSGEERFIVAMFVDMRGSTRLAEDRLPFDTIFLINRFLEAVARAVNASGGQPNQFLGDGMLALFGLTEPPDAAARAALAATAAIGTEIDALNVLLGHDLPEPIRFGIGLHAGTAVLGEIGGQESGHRVFTAIGDPVNVAARLQGMTKRLGVEVVVSEAVYQAIRLKPTKPATALAIDGREGTIDAVPVKHARDLADVASTTTEALAGTPAPRGHA